VLKIVESTVFFGIDLMSCKCFAELLEKLFNNVDLNGKLATLP
jgi:hypothetical protein